MKQDFFIIYMVRCIGMIILAILLLLIYAILPFEIHTHYTLRGIISVVVVISSIFISIIWARFMVKAKSHVGSKIGLIAWFGLLLSGVVFFFYIIIGMLIDAYIKNFGLST